MVKNTDNSSGNLGDVAFCRDIWGEDFQKTRGLLGSPNQKDFRMFVLPLHQRKPPLM